MSDAAAARARDLELPPPCFKCGAVLDPAVPRWPTNQPHDGLMFYAAGNYGSAIHDPCGHERAREELLVVICDACVRRAAERYPGIVRVVETERPAPPRITTTAWEWQDPEAEPVEPTEEDYAEARRVLDEVRGKVEAVGEHLADHENVTHEGDDE